MYITRRCCLLALAAASLFAGQGEHPVTGRKIAGVMGVQGADWLNRPEREKEENPEGALNALEHSAWNGGGGRGRGHRLHVIAPGEARRTGRQGLRERSSTGDAAAAAARMRPRPGSRILRRCRVKRPIRSFRRASMDLVLLVDVYHEFSKPREMIDKIRESLKPDGRLVLLEYRKEDPNVPIREEHKMTVAEVKAELEPQGFVLSKVIETLPRQHILILTKAAAKAAAN